MWAGGEAPGVAGPGWTLGRSVGGGEVAVEPLSLFCGVGQVGVPPLKVGG